MSVGAVLTLAGVSSSSGLAAGGDEAGALPLSYERAAGAERCPAERAVQETFRDQLAGHHLEKGRNVRVRVAPGSGHSPEIVGRVELTDAEGTRLWANELQERPQECATLVATLALSLRVFLGKAQQPPPEIHRPSGEDASSPEGSQEPIVVQGKPVPRSETPSPTSAKTIDARAPPDAAPTPQKPPPPERSIVGELDRPANHRAWVSLALVAGAAPRATARFTVGYSVRWPGVSFGVEMRGAPPVSGDYDGNEIHVAHWESAFVPCVSGKVLFVCGLLSAGAKWVQVTGPAADDVSAFRAGGGARAGVEIEIIPRLSLFGHVDIEGTFWPSLVRVSETAFFREASGQIALGLAVAGTFPGR